ncbi:hypothetical protein OUZ56_016791 [Daphnia magna]|uniref:Uncharacterized protein n=1 Tax=Daphnia magna TaxID=35525 RepID=A0ABR0ARK5_9CRUS|nr:hypothetical protein OUZ56_016791 [Daphnia magna]
MKRIKELVDSIENENHQELLKRRRDKYRNKGRTTTSLGHTEDHHVHHIAQTQSTSNDGIVTANIEEYERIQSVIAQMREDAIMRVTVNIENIPGDQPSRRWQERQQSIKETWLKMRATVVKNYVRNQGRSSEMLK